jgi:hypothetical protein
MIEKFSMGQEEGHLSHLSSLCTCSEEEKEQWIESLNPLPGNLEHAKIS